MNIRYETPYLHMIEAGSIWHDFKDISFQSQAHILFSRQPLPPPPKGIAFAIPQGDRPGGSPGDPFWGLGNPMGDPPVGPPPMAIPA